MDESAGMKGMIFQRLDTKKYEFFVEKIRMEWTDGKKLKTSFLHLFGEEK